MSKEKTKVLVDNCLRSVLCEGRNYGMGFAIAKREGDTYSLVQPISPCKDYLNDVVFSENTGTPWRAYGLSTVKTGCFEPDRFFMVISICMRGARSPAPYSGYEADVAALEANHKSIEKLMNWWEDKFNVVGRTVIEKLQDNRFLVTGPKFWIEGTYRISLYSLLMRMGLRYKEGDPLTYLDGYKGDDVGLWNSSKHKVMKMLEGKIPVQDMTISFDVHNCGIVGYNFS